ncbi:single-stranded DNA-binding protein [Nocardioides sp. C4-1]|uniref:single-stranded DNA-binding protein n=1 Tax=Nocardioides sp. C4-1 TaxID=3151851 RepID=UPI003264F17F
MAAQVQEQIATVNEVRLMGRVSADPVVRELPSGDEIVAVRVVFARPPSTRSKVRVDAVECVAYGAGPRRSAASWRPGDVVEVSGALRRRFFSSGGGRASLVEVEMARGRLVRRATSG